MHKPESNSLLTNETYRYTTDDYWTALYRRRGIILVMTIASAVFSGWFSSLLTPLYEASAQFYVPQDAVSAIGGPQRGQIRVPGAQDQARTYVSLLETRDAHVSVAEQLPNRDLSDVLRAADFDVTPAASLIVYTRDKDPEIAKQMAGLFVAFFQDFHTKIVRGDLQKAIENVERELAGYEVGRNDQQRARSSYLRENDLGSPSAAMQELEAQRARFEDRLRLAAVDLLAAEEKLEVLNAKLESEQADYSAGRVAAEISDQLYTSLRRDVTTAYVDRDTIARRHAELINSRDQASREIQELSTTLERVREFDDEIQRNQDFITNLRATRVALTSELLRLQDTILVLQAPAVSTSPVFPIIWLNVFIGLIGGALLGVVYALLLDQLDSRAQMRALQNIDEQDWFEKAFRAVTRSDAGS
jgi:uncharacterized protein involved in exopolysaccharide biosynthesis